MTSLRMPGRIPLFDIGTLQYPSPQNKLFGVVSVNLPTLSDATPTKGTEDISADQIKDFPSTPTKSIMTDYLPSTFDTVRNWEYR